MPAMKAPSSVMGSLSFFFVVQAIFKNHFKVAIDAKSKLINLSDFEQSSLDWLNPDHENNIAQYKERNGLLSKRHFIYLKCVQFQEKKENG